MKEENLTPTPGASGVTAITTRFYKGDKLRYCVLEYWNCGAHEDEAYCGNCRKRVVAFRYSKKAALAVIDSMLEAALP